MIKKIRLDEIDVSQFTSIKSREKWYDNQDHSRWIFYDVDNKLYYMATTDQSHPDYDVLNDLERQLMNINLDDKYLIPIYHDFDDIVKNSENNILPFSYLNYIRLGDIILMPININTSDAKKLEIKNIFKHDNLIFIEAYGLLNEGGGLHCCSMNILYKQ